MDLRQSIVEQAAKMAVQGPKLLFHHPCQRQVHVRIVVVVLGTMAQFAILMVPMADVVRNTGKSLFFILFFPIQLIFVSHTNYFLSQILRLYTSSLWARLSKRLQQWNTSSRPTTSDDQRRASNCTCFWNNSSKPRCRNHRWNVWALKR